jgi:hypothetical protein
MLNSQVGMWGSIYGGIAGGASSAITAGMMPK